VIIPATSTPELLSACLRSLSRFGPERIPYEVIVVLNRATPRIEASLRRMVRGVAVVGSPVNLGLAGAANRGRGIARGEYLAILHDDAEIKPGWLEALVETADKHPEAGAVGSQVLFPDGRLQSAGMILWRDATTSPLVETSAGTAFSQLRAVDFCGTSSLLVRTAAWDAVDGLDERFYPVYYVDVDLSMSLRRLGLVMLYEPNSRIHHHQGASSSPPFRRFLQQTNRRHFIEKWGAALERHEPVAEDKSAAVQRALTRAEAFALNVRQKQITPLRSPMKPILSDLVAQERDCLKKSRSLRRAYIAHLMKRGGPWIYKQVARFLRRANIAVSI
jgi:GT2 family glycosyltransferase